MELLKQRILADARVLEGNVLGVDHFLNQQIDTRLLSQLARELHRLFADCGATKILTVEAAGIAIATLTAGLFEVPLVFAKKSRQGEAPHMLCAKVDTATFGQHFEVVVPQGYITPDDRVLIIDDFLARGSTMFALLDLVKAAGAAVAGCGVMIEKAFRGGGEKLRKMGVRLESLAKIQAISVESGITFAE